MMRETFPTGQSDLTYRFDKSAKPILSIDVQKYQSYLDESGLTQAQKQEFLQALWSVIVSFVELGFGVHPLQEVCGQSELPRLPHAKEAFNALTSGEPKDTKIPIDSALLAGLEPE